MKNWAAHAILNSLMFFYGFGCIIFAASYQGPKPNFSQFDLMLMGLLIVFSTMFSIISMANVFINGDLKIDEKDEIRITWFAGLAYFAIIASFLGWILFLF